MLISAYRALIRSLRRRSHSPTKPTMPPAPSSSAITVVTRTFSHAEILSLPLVPQIIAPAPGPRKVIQFVAGSIVVRLPDGPYAHNPADTLSRLAITCDGTDVSTSAFAGNGDDILTGTGGWPLLVVRLHPNQFTWEVSPLLDVPNTIENAPLMVTCWTTTNAHALQGGGPQNTVSVTVHYFEVSL